MSPWTIGWLIWAGWFFVEEFTALYRVGTRGTLSYLLWTVFATRRRGTHLSAPGPLPAARRVVLVVALAWLVPHLLFGGTVV